MFKMTLNSANGFFVNYEKAALKKFILVIEQEENNHV